MNMDEIAKKAGVSKAAVSFALNDKPGISQVTRNHILNVAEELKYVPRKKQKRDTIVFILVTNDYAQSLDYFQRLPFFQSIIDAFKTKSYLKGYNLSIQTVSEINQSTLEIWQRKNVLGAVILGTFLTDNDLALLNTAHTNIIILDNPSKKNSHSSVVINNQEGIERIVNLIPSEDTVLYVHGLPDNPNFQERNAAFKLLNQSKNFDLTEIEMDSFNFSESTTFEEQTIVEALQKAKTIVTENDYLALKIARIAYENKLTHNIKTLYGFDNISTVRQSPIPIKTVSVNVSVMVDISIDLILKEYPTSVQAMVNTSSVKGGNE